MEKILEQHAHDVATDEGMPEAPAHIQKFEYDTETGAVAITENVNANAAVDALAASLVAPRQECVKSLIPLTDPGVKFVDGPETIELPVSTAVKLNCDRTLPPEQASELMGVKIEPLVGEPEVGKLYAYPVSETITTADIRKADEELKKISAQPDENGNITVAITSVHAKALNDVLKDDAAVEQLSAEGKKIDYDGIKAMLKATGWKEAEDIIVPLEEAEARLLAQSTCACDNCLEEAAPANDDFTLLYDMIQQLATRVADLEARIEAHNVRASHKI